MFWGFELFVTMRITDPIFVFVICDLTGSLCPLQGKKKKCNWLNLLSPLGIYTTVEKVNICQHLLSYCLQNTWAMFSNRVRVS